MQVTSSSRALSSALQPLPERRFDGLRDRAHPRNVAQLTMEHQPHARHLLQPTTLRASKDGQRLRRRAQALERKGTGSGHFEHFYIVDVGASAA
jgi:hypothetical protein